MKAKFDKPCPLCKLNIEAGTIITKCHGKLVHPSCATQRAPDRIIKGEGERSAERARLYWERENARVRELRASRQKP